MRLSKFLEDVFCVILGFLLGFGLIKLSIFMFTYDVQPDLASHQIVVERFGEKIANNAQDLNCAKDLAQGFFTDSWCAKHYKHLFDNE